MMDDTKTRHPAGVWNPSYGADVMESHILLLRDKANQLRSNEIDEVVSDDTLAVVDELKKLRNVAYHDMPVSIYGGMVNLPLIVTRLMVLDTSSTTYATSSRMAGTGSSLTV